MHMTTGVRHGADRLSKVIFSRFKKCKNYHKARGMKDQVFFIFYFFFFNFFIFTREKFLPAISNFFNFFKFFCFRTRENIKVFTLFSVGKFSARQGRVFPQFLSIFSDWKFLNFLGPRFELKPGYFVFYLFF